MSELTEQLMERLEPVQALVIYKSPKNYYIESHAITKDGMGPGVALSEDTLSDVVTFFHEKQKSIYLKGAIPSEVIYADWSAEKKVLIWFEAPQKRKMYFTKELKIKNGEAFQPGLIFLLKNESLYVYAVAGKSISENEQLYQAPYHNVDNNGSVCLGSANVNSIKQTYEGVMSAYSTLFWNSEFSHAAGAVAPINGNINTFWREQIKSKSPFDYAVLKPIKKTIKNLLNAQNR